MGIALVGGTKGAGEAFEESDGSTGYENGRCGRISTAPEGYAARAVDCVSNGLENQRRVEKGFHLEVSTGAKTYNYCRIFQSFQLGQFQDGQFMPELLNMLAQSVTLEWFQEQMLGWLNLVAS